MTALHRAINRARRRLAADLAIRGAGRGLAVAAGTGVALLLLERLAGVEVWAGVYPLAALAGLLLGGALAAGRRPGSLGAAVRLDRSLDLDDRLGTAAEVRAGRLRGAFADLAADRAERLADAIDVAAATPIRVTRIWGVAATLAGALGLGLLFLPALWAAAQPAPDAGALREQRTRISRTIEQTVAEIDDPELDQASRRELDTLEALARQLEGQDSATDLADTRDRSAAHIDEMADRLAEEADRNLQAVDQVTRKFNDLESLQGPPEARAFSDALREGDLDEAARRFDELIEQADGLPDDQRQALSEQLRQLGDQLRPDAESAPDDDDARLQQLREAMKDLGAGDRPLDELLEEAMPEIERMLQDQGVDRDTLQRMTRDLAELKRREEVRRQAESQQDELGEALEDAARKIEQPQRPDRAESDQPEMPDMPDTPDTPDKSDMPDGQGEQDERAPQQQQAQREPGQQAPGQEQVKQEPQRAPRQDGSPAAADRGEADQQERPDQQTPDRQVADGAAPGAKPERGEQSEGREPAEAVRQSTGQQEDGEQAEDRPGAVPGESPAQGPGEQGPARSFSDMLRRLQDSRRDAARRQEMSRRLAERARELADTLTEQEKRQIAEQWMRRGGGEPSVPPGTSAGAGPPNGDDDDAATAATARRSRDVDDVDLRGEPPDEDGRIIARWLSPDAPGGPAATDGGRAIVAEARSEAERAVDESVVPSRYHAFIQRYFGRLGDTVDKAAHGAVSTGASTDPDSKP